MGRWGEQVKFSLQILSYDCFIKATACRRWLKLKPDTTHTRLHDAIAVITVGQVGEFVL